MIDLVSESGAEIVGHCHVSTKGKTDKDIEADTIKLIDKIQKVFSY